MAEFPCPLLSPKQTPQDFNTMPLSPEATCAPSDYSSMSSSAAEIHRLRTELAALVADLAYEKQERDKARAVTTVLLKFIAGDDTNLSFADRALKNKLKRANAECVKLRARLLLEKSKSIQLKMLFDSLQRENQKSVAPIKREHALANDQNHFDVSDVNDSERSEAAQLFFCNGETKPPASLYEQKSLANGNSKDFSPPPGAQFVHRFLSNSEPEVRKTSASIVEAHGYDARSAFKVIKQRDVIKHESDFLSQKQPKPHGGRCPSETSQSARNKSKHNRHASSVSFETSSKSSVRSKSSKNSASKAIIISSANHNNEEAKHWRRCPPPKWFNRNLGCLFEPPPGTPETRRVVVIGNIPPHTRLEQVLAMVRGGQVLSSELHNTLNVTNALTASVEFVSQESAEAYASFAQKNPIWIRGRCVSVTHLLTATCPIPLRVLMSVERHHHTRCLLVRSEKSFMSLRELKYQLRRGDGVDSHGLLVFKRQKNCSRLLSFKSVDAAGWAYAKIQGFDVFFGYQATWAADPCELPVQTILEACRPETPVKNGVARRLPPPPPPPPEVEEDLISLCSFSDQESLESSAIISRSVAEYEYPIYAPRVNLGRKRVDYSDLI